MSFECRKDAHVRCSGPLLASPGRPQRRKFGSSPPLQSITLDSTYLQWQYHVAYFKIGFVPKRFAWPLGGGDLRGKRHGRRPRTPGELQRLHEHFEVESLHHVTPDNVIFVLEGGALVMPLLSWKRISQNSKGPPPPPARPFPVLRAQGSRGQNNFVDKEIVVR